MADQPTNLWEAFDEAQGEATPIAPEPAPIPQVVDVPWKAPDLWDAADEAEAGRHKLFRDLASFTNKSAEDHAGILEIIRKTGASKDEVEARFPEWKLAVAGADVDPIAFKNEHPDLYQLIIERPEIGQMVQKDGAMVKFSRALRDAFEGVDWGRQAEIGRATLGLRGQEAEEVAQRMIEEARAKEHPGEGMPAEMIVDPAKELGALGKVFGGNWEFTPWGTGPGGEEIGGWHPRTQGIIQRELTKGALTGERARIGSLIAKRVILGQDTWDLEKEAAELDYKMRPRWYGDDILANVLADTANLFPSQVYAYGGALGTGALAAGATFAVTKNPALASLAWKAGGLTGGWLTSFGLEFGNAVLDYRDLRTDDGQKLDPRLGVGAAIVYGTAAATIEVATELKYGLARLGPIGEMIRRGQFKSFVADATKDWSNVPLHKMLRDVGKAWVQGAAGEGVEEFLQQATQDSIGYLARSATAGSWQDADVVGSLADSLESFRAAFVGSLVMGGASAPLNLRSQLYMREIAERSKALSAETTEATQTPTGKGSPGLVAALVERATERYGAEPLTTMYLDPVDGFLRLFQGPKDSKIDPKMVTPAAEHVATEIMGPDGPARLREAVATGQKLAIPIGEFTDRWAGRVGLLEQIAPHLTTRPIEVSEARQAELDLQATQKAANIVKELERGTKPITEAEKPLVQLYEQLRSTGRMTVEQARNGVFLARKFVNTQAIKEKVSVESLVADWVMRVRLDEAQKTRAADVARLPPAEQAAHGIADEKFTDPQLKVGNRAAYEDFKSRPREGVHVVADVDNLKATNDTQGHPVGDKLLTAVAELLKGAVHGNDGKLFRTGGDEFVAHFDTRAQAEAFVEALTKAAEGAPEVAPGVKARVSVGLSGGLTEDGVKGADAAMYAAKELGRQGGPPVRAQWGLAAQTDLSRMRQTPGGYDVVQVFWGRVAAKATARLDELVLEHGEEAPTLPEFQDAQREYDRAQAALSARLEQGPRTYYLEDALEREWAKVAKRLRSEKGPAAVKAAIREARQAARKVISKFKDPEKEREFFRVARKHQVYDAFVQYALSLPEESRPMTDAEWEDLGESIAQPIGDFDAPGFNDNYEGFEGSLEQGPIEATGVEATDAEVRRFPSRLQDLGLREYQEVMRRLDREPEGDRIHRNLVRFAGTGYARGAIIGALGRAQLDAVLAGNEVDFDGPLTTPQAGAILEKLKAAQARGKGIDALFEWLTAGNVLGEADKPGLALNSSFLNCQPSEGCAIYCYGTRGPISFARNILRSEIITMVIEREPVRLAEIVANEYRATGNWRDQVALRINDKGDISPAWLPFLAEMEKREVRLQIFTRRDDLVDKISAYHLTLLSADHSDRSAAERNPSTLVAYVYNGSDEDAAWLNAHKEHIGVILPVMVGRGFLPKVAYAKLDKGLLPTVCPPDRGYVSVSRAWDVRDLEGNLVKRFNETSDPRAREKAEAFAAKRKEMRVVAPRYENWHCAKCDSRGGVGCYYGRTTEQMNRIATPIEVRQIKELSDGLVVLARSRPELAAELATELAALKTGVEQRALGGRPGELVEGLAIAPRQPSGGGPEAGVAGVEGAPGGQGAGRLEQGPAAAPAALSHPLVADVGPTFFSQAVRAVYAHKEDKTTGARWANILAKGVKAEELEWVYGLQDFLKAKSLTKRQVAEYVASHIIQPRVIELNQVAGEMQKELEEAQGALEDNGVEININGPDDAPDYKVVIADPMGGADLVSGWGVAESISRWGFEAAINYPQEQAAIVQEQVDSIMRAIDRYEIAYGRVSSQQAEVGPIWEEYSLAEQDGAVMVEGSYRVIGFYVPGVAESFRAHTFGKAAKGLVSWIRTAQYKLLDGRVVQVAEEFQSDLHQRAQARVRISRREADQLEAQAKASEQAGEKVDWEAVRRNTERLRAESGYDTGTERTLEDVTAFLRANRYAINEDRQGFWIRSQVTGGQVGDESRTTAGRLLRGFATREEALAFAAKDPDRFAGPTNYMDVSYGELVARGAPAELYQAFARLMNEQDGLPKAPWRGAGFQEVGFRYLTRYALERGVDQIAWTTGDQQNSRYHKEDAPEGMRTWYDKLLPAYVRKWLKVEPTLQPIEANVSAEAIVEAGAAYELVRRLARDLATPGHLTPAQRAVAGPLYAKLSDASINQSRTDFLVSLGWEPLTETLSPGEAARKYLGRVQETTGVPTEDLYTLAPPLKVWAVEVPAETRDRILNEGVSLFAGEEQKGGPRGWTEMIRSGMKRVFDIVLSRDSDFSTFVHESGHVFWEILADLAERPEASAGLKTDYALALRYMGVKDRGELHARLAQAEQIRRQAAAEGRVLTSEEQGRINDFVAPFEKWARSFEAYLFEGKSPSRDMDAAFTRFHLWLRGIYGRVEALGVELNPEIRGVFDRMIATDTEIARVKDKMSLESAFRSPEEAGMDGPAWAAHLDRLKEAMSHQERAAQFRVMRDRLKATERWWKDARRQLLDAAYAEYDAQPAAKALALLRRGEGGGNPALEALLAEAKRRETEKGPVQVPPEVEKLLAQMEERIQEVRVQAQLAAKEAEIMARHTGERARFQGQLGTPEDVRRRAIAELAGENKYPTQTRSEVRTSYLLHTVDPEGGEGTWAVYGGQEVPIAPVEVDETTLLEKGREEIRAVTLPSWLSAQEYLEAKAAWDWTFEAFDGKQTAPEVLQRQAFLHFSLALADFPEMNGWEAQKGWFLAHIHAGKSHQSRIWLANKLDTWAAQPENARPADPIPDTLWGRVLQRKTAQAQADRWIKAAKSKLTKPSPSEVYLYALYHEPAWVSRVVTAAEVAKEQEAAKNANAEREQLLEKLIAERDRVREQVGAEAILAAKGKPKLDYDKVAAIAPRQLKTVFRGLLTSAGGLDPDYLAQILQAESGEKLIADIAQIPGRRSWAERRADALMAERFPDVLDDREKLRDIVGKGLHGDATLGWLLHELHVLRLKLGVNIGDRLEAIGAGSAGLAEESIRRAAAVIVEGKALNNLNAGTFLNGEQKASADAIEAAAKGDYEAAYVARHQQILNYLVYRALLDAKEEKADFLAEAQHLQKPSVHNRMGKYAPAYRDGIDQILQAVGLARSFPRAAPFVPFSALIGQRVPVALDANGQPTSYTYIPGLLERDGNTITFDVDLIQRLIANPLQKPDRGEAWGQLTMRDMREVMLALEAIKAAADDRAEVIVGKEKADFQETVNALIAEAVTNLPNRGAVPSTESGQTVTEWAFHKIASGDADLLRIATMASWLGGRDVRSKWWQAIIMPMQHAKHREADLMRAAAKVLLERWEAIPKRLQVKMRDKVDGKALFPNHRKDIQAPTRRFELVAMALNRGNPENLDRLLQGRGITLSQLDRALALLSNEELAWVQSVWDAFSKTPMENGKTLWQLLVELEGRDSGAVPKKVQAAAFTINGITYAGGYYPAVYDRRVSDLGEKQAIDSVGAMFDQGYTRPFTSHSFLQMRAKDFHDVISLEPSVIHFHLSQVVHDIAFREAVKSVGKLLLNDEVRAVMRERLGKERTDEFITWAKDIGSMRGAQTFARARAWNRLFRWLRSNMASAILKYAIDIPLGDLTNLTVYVARSPNRKFLAGAIAECLDNPAKTRAWALEKFGELRFREHHLLERWENVTKRWTRRTFVGSEWFYAFLDNGYVFFDLVDRLTATPIAIAEYRAWLAAHPGDEEGAVAAANKFVSDVLPSHHPVDASSVMRDRGFVGASMLFHGYMNTIYQMRRDIVHDVYLAGHTSELEGLEPSRARDAKELAKAIPVAIWKMMALVVAYNVLGEWVSGRGAEPGEDAWEWWFRKMLMGMTVNDLPFGAGVEPIATKIVTGTARMTSQRAAPGLAVADALVRAGVAAANPDVDPEKAAFAVARALALATGFPMRPMRPVEYVTKVAQGETAPEWPYLPDVLNASIYSERQGQAANPITDVQRVIDYVRKP